MYMNKMTEAKFLLSTVKDSTRSRGADEESYSKSYERAIQVMDELELEKRHHSGNQTSFSSFLSRNKEPDFIAKEAKGKRSDSDPGFRRSYVSPSPVSGMPRVPFTQPRRRDWERPDPAGGCFRKLHFDHAVEVKGGSSGNYNHGPNVPSTGSETSVITSLDPHRLSKAITEARNRKKSWADMVEEDEQILLESTKNWNSGDEYDDENVDEEDERILLESTRNSWKNDEDYGDENVDCNITTDQKFESLSIQDGYQSQPGTATCQTNQTANQSLTFDTSQSTNDDQNYWCSLQNGAADYGNDRFSSRKAQMQVFQNRVRSSEGSGTSK